MEDLEAVVAYLREEGGCCNVKHALLSVKHALLLACGTSWRGLEAVVAYRERKVGAATLWLDAWCNSLVMHCCWVVARGGGAWKRWWPTCERKVRVATL